MLWSAVRKGLYHAAAAYLVLAVMGAFTFTSLDVPGFEDLAGENTVQGVLLTSLACPVECLAVSTAKGHSFSPPRQCLPRMALPSGFLAAGPGLSCAAGRSVTMTAAHDKKSAIPLKLLI